MKKPPFKVFLRLYINSDSEKSKVIFTVKN